MKLYGFQKELNKLPNLLKSNPNPILLFGKEHIGKTTLSNFVIKGFFCDKGDLPCGECSSCRRFENHNEVDFLYIEDTEGKNQLKLEQVELIKEFCLTKPLQNEYKVIFVKDIHKFNLVSQNALLKTLEEPMEFVRFVFTSSNPDYILDTIKSRTIMFPIYAIDKEHIKEYIVDNYTGLSEEDLNVVLEYSNSIYDVNLLLNEELGFKELRQDIFNYLISIPSEKVFNIYNKSLFMDNIERWGIMKQTIINILFDVLYYKLDIQSYITNIDKTDEIKQLSIYARKDDLIKSIEEVQKLNEFMNMNLKKDLIMNNLSLALIRTFRKK